MKKKGVDRELKLDTIKSSVTCSQKSEIYHHNNKTDVELIPLFITKGTLDKINLKWLSQQQSQ